MFKWFSHLIVSLGLTLSSLFPSQPKIVEIPKHVVKVVQNVQNVGTVPVANTPAPTKSKPLLKGVDVPVDPEQQQNDQLSFHQQEINNLNNRVDTIANNPVLQAPVSQPVVPPNPVPPPPQVQLTPPPPPVVVQVPAPSPKPVMVEPTTIYIKDDSSAPTESQLSQMTQGSVYTLAAVNISRDGNFDIANIQKLTFTDSGIDGDMQSFKLFFNGNQVGSTVSESNGKVTFNLNSLGITANNNISVLLKATISSSAVSGNSHAFDLSNVVATGLSVSGSITPITGFIQ